MQQHKTFNVMSNEEKARELDAKFKNFMYSPKQGPSFQQCLTEMAEWKDDYYKKLLDLLVKSGANADIITDYIENCI